MNLELFPKEVVTMDSPRLAWVKKHGVKTLRSKHCDRDPWCAWFPDNEDSVGGIPVDPESCGYGPTEEAALRDLGVVCNVTLWNEEGERAA